MMPAARVLGGETISRARLSAGRSLPSGAVVLAVEGRRLFKLNRVGSRVWELAADAKPVLEIVATIAREFDVSPDGIRQDVFAFVGELVERGILVARDPGADQ